jgi:predicted ATPase
MTALYRSGRQADALAAYHRAREALDEQLGIEPGAELRALEAAILRQDVPAAGAAPAPSGSLPIALTRFIGRRRELAEIERLLGRARLVTLTGVGGVGKTRLAIEAAARALEGQVDRVALVDLAALADPGLVVDHVATAIGGADSGSAGSIGAIREAIGTDDVLLVLDNCEHVHDAAAALAQTLLAGSPDLRILATSRVALDVAGEAPYPVPPLALIESGDDGDGTTSDAVELLLDRASLTRHDLVVDADAYATAARICQDLDGLPLAIELAAARMKALSIDEVAGRIRDRFQFLVSWRRLTSARHRTLRETMDWSYELLEPDEQQLLARLSVFPAGASRASIAVVCLDGDDDEAERLIERLVDASLIVPVEGSRGTRYRQLETVRQYGAGLLPDDDAERLRRRHAEHLLEVALSTGLSLETSGVDPDAAAMSFDVAREELPSLRAAIAWAMTGDPRVALAIACALERFWVSSHVREGAEILTALLELPAVAGHARARVLRCRGGCRYSAGEYEAGMADYEAALAIHRSLGERAHEAHLLMRVAFEADRLGDRRRTQALLDEAAALGGAARFPTDAYAGASLASRLAFEDGRDEDGFALLREASARTAAVGDSWWRSGIEARIAERAFELGRLDEGGAAARESLRTAVVIDGRQSIAWALGLLAREAAARGLDRRAGMIWGGIEAEVARGLQVEDWEEDRVELLRMITKQSEAAFDEGVLEGHALSLAEVVELGLAEG